MNPKILLCALIYLLAIPWAGAATNLGLYVTPVKPTLRLDYGNLTDYAKINPGPALMDLGPAGTYFHGNNTISLEETAPERPPGVFLYGGPGDSWSTLTLVSPTPASTRDTPIVYRFDSHITNFNYSVGYATWGSTDDYLLWHFNQPGTNVHFRVEWSIQFITVPFVIQSCQFIPPFTFVCTDVTVGSAGNLGIAIAIEGFGSRTLYPSPGGTATIGPGNQTYSGTVSGIALDSRLGLRFDNGLSVGQSNRGDCRVIVELRVYADLEPLSSPPVIPSIHLAATSGNSLALSWPSLASTYLLQQNTDPGTTNWVNVTQLPNDDGTNKTVLITSTNGRSFFRLFKP